MIVSLRGFVSDSIWSYFWRNPIKENAYHEKNRNARLLPDLWDFLLRGSWERFQISWERSFPRNPIFPTNPLVLTIVYSIWYIYLPAAGGKIFEGIFNKNEEVYIVFWKVYNIYFFFTMAPNHRILGQNFGRKLDFSRYSYWDFLGVNGDGRNHFRGVFHVSRSAEPC